MVNIFFDFLTSSFDNLLKLFLNEKKVSIVAKKVVRENSNNSILTE